MKPFVYCIILLGIVILSVSLFFLLPTKSHGTKESLNSSFVQTYSSSNPIAMTYDYSVPKYVCTSGQNAEPVGSPSPGCVVPQSIAEAICNADPKCIGYLGVDSTDPTTNSVRLISTIPVYNSKVAPQKWFIPPGLTESSIQTKSDTWKKAATQTPSS